MTTGGHRVLYLLEPTLTLLQNRIPGSSALEPTNEHLLDLAGLDWQTAERRGDRDILRLALIYGHACSRGIVLDARLVVELDHGAFLTRTYRDRERSRARTRPHQDAVDQWLGTTPSAAHNRRAQDLRIAEQHAEDVQRAAARAAKRLSADPDPGLLRHWASLGGPAL